MAFVFDADPVSATMSSYVTVSFADDYFSAKFTGAGWADLSTELKQAALVSATNILDTYVYGGLRAQRLQPLQWPRSGIYNDEGTPYSSATVVTKVQQATCELAHWIYTEGDRTLDDTTLQQLDNFQAGPVNFKIRSKAMVVPLEVQALLTSIGPGVLLSMGSNGGPKSIGMNL